MTWTAAYWMATPAKSACRRSVVAVPGSNMPRRGGRGAARTSGRMQRQAATGRHHKFARQGSSHRSIQTSRPRPEGSCTSHSCRPGQRWRANRASAPWAIPKVRMTAANGSNRCKAELGKLKVPSRLVAVGQSWALSGWFAPISTIEIHVAGDSNQYPSNCSGSNSTPPKSMAPDRSSEKTNLNWLP